MRCFRRSAASALPLVVALAAAAGGSAPRDSVRVRVHAAAASIRLAGAPHVARLVLGQTAAEPVQFRVPAQTPAAARSP